MGKGGALQSCAHEGVAMLRLGVNADGKVTSSKIAYEHPAGLKFGGAVLGPIRDADFIPAYRHGQPSACQFDFTLIFNGPGVQMKTG